MNKYKEKYFVWTDIWTKYRISFTFGKKKISNILSTHKYHHEKVD